MNDVTLEENDPIEILQELWKEHGETPFPNGLRGKDVNGIDFVMLDADIAGCVQGFLDKVDLPKWCIAHLGLCYWRAGFVQDVLHEDGVSYYWRLERMAEIVLRELAKQKEDA